MPPDLIAAYVQVAHVHVHVCVVFTSIALGISAKYLPVSTMLIQVTGNLYIQVSMMLIEVMRDSYLQVSVVLI